MSTSPRSPLTRARVLEAAIAIVDRESPGALTMRRLGADLGVEAMSLYNHVANKQDVIDGMAGLLVSRMTDFTTFEEDWRNVVLRIARAYRAVTAAHPGVFMMAAGRPLISGDDQEAFDATMGRLLDAGFSQELASDLFNTCVALVHGFLFSEAAYGSASRAGGVAWDDERAFERGLDAIVDGFARMLARERGRHGA